MADDEAEQAYKAAQDLIAQVLKHDLHELSFQGKKLQALTKIPPEITKLKKIISLNLNNTQVGDIAALEGMRALQSLYLRNTQVSDIAALEGMRALQSLDLGNTQVSDIAALEGTKSLQLLDLEGSHISDLRPIRENMNLTILSLSWYGLHFQNTPAAKSNRELELLSKINDNKQRTSETLAYLKTLSPYPEPLPWEVEDQRLPENNPQGLATVAQQQITFLLEHAATTQVSAATTASQIRYALRDVPATHGNQLAPALKAMISMAAVLDKLASDPINSDSPDKKSTLEARIAELEATVINLTEQLSDENKAREAAEAKAKGNGVWANYKAASGKALGYGQFAVAGTGIHDGLVYFLGTENFAVIALLSLIK